MKKYNNYYNLSDYATQDKQAFRLREDETFKDDLRSPFAIFELDHEFNIVYYNETLFNIFKLNNNTEIAFNTLFFDQSKETIIKHAQNVFQTREYLQFECTLINLHGKEFFAQIEILPLTYENTKNLLIIITDITEKKRIDEFHIKENRR